MGGPEHLWSGDWESDSAAAAARRARPLPELEPEPAPAPPPRAPSRRQPRRLAWPRRTVLFVAIGALVLAGAAYGLSSLGHSGAQTAETQTAWLGARLLPWPGGVLIDGVVPGSPADRAGLHRGDLIVEVEGRPVVAAVDVSAAVDALRPGQTLTIIYRRGSAIHTTHAMLTGRPSGVSWP